MVSESPRQVLVCHASEHASYGVLGLLLDLPQVKFTAEALGREVMIEIHQAVRPGHDSVPVGIGVVGEGNVESCRAATLDEALDAGLDEILPPAPDGRSEGRKIVDDLARRHGVGSDAVAALLCALELGNGAQVQFNHPDLGGMGQWSQGGMIMIGDMFNQCLKHRVDSLCHEIANLLRCQPSLNQPDASHSQSQGRSGGYDGVSLFIPGSGRSSSNWWPTELGGPASTGAQNNLQYACSRSLAASQSGMATR